MAKPPPPSPLKPPPPPPAQKKPCYTLHPVYCTLGIAECTGCSVQYPVCITQGAVCGVQYTVCIVHYGVQCAICKARFAVGSV